MKPRAHVHIIMQLHNLYYNNINGVSIYECTQTDVLKYIHNHNTNVQYCAESQFDVLMHPWS